MGNAEPCFWCAPALQHSGYAGNAWPGGIPQETWIFRADSLRISTCKDPMNFVFNMYASIYYTHIYIYMCLYKDPRYLTAYYISISSGSQEAAALAPARSTYPTYPLLRQLCKSACEEASARNDSAAFDVNWKVTNFSFRRVEICLELPTESG